jgi:hypothetical protein
MHEQVRAHKRKRSGSRDSLAILIAVVIALALARIAHRYGMPQKWHAAILGTVVPFCAVIFVCPERWKRYSFWGSVAMWLVVHTLAIYFLFSHVLSNVRTIGTLFWWPVAFVETFALLAAVIWVDEKLAHKSVTWD